MAAKTEKPEATEGQTTVAELLAKIALLETQNAELENAVKLAVADEETLRKQLQKAQKKGGVPEGFVLLPIEPTEGIMLAGSDDQVSPWDSDAKCRVIRRNVLRAVVNHLLNPAAKA